MPPMWAICPAPQQNAVETVDFFAASAKKPMDGALPLRNHHGQE